MMRLTLPAALYGCLLLVPAATAQPNVPIDNAQVRVVVVTDRAHAKSPLHEHKTNRVMVFLDAGGQDLRRADGTVVRERWKAGDALWSPMIGRHTSENVGDEPFRVVEIELKKPGGGAPHGGPLDPVRVAPKIYSVIFGNPQVRVLRVHYGPHEKGPMHEHHLNRVVVYLTDQDMRIQTPDGKTQAAAAKAGEVRWASGYAKHAEENLSDRPLEVIAVEIK